jgi:hypothetical protein
MMMLGERREANHSEETGAAAETERQAEEDEFPF